MSGQRHTVKLRTDDTAALAARILDVYVVTGGFRRWKWCLCRRRNTPHYVHRPPQTWSSAAIFQGVKSLRPDVLAVHTGSQGMNEMNGKGEI